MPGLALKRIDPGARGTASRGFSRLPLYSTTGKNAEASFMVAKSCLDATLDIVGIKSAATELTNLPCGTVQIRVCEDNICATWLGLAHTTWSPTKEKSN